MHISMSLIKTTYSLGTQPLKKEITRIREERTLQVPIRLHTYTSHTTVRLIIPCITIGERGMIHTCNTTMYDHQTHARHPVPDTNSRIPTFNIPLLGLGLSKIGPGSEKEPTYLLRNLLVYRFESGIDPSTRHLLKAETPLFFFFIYTRNEPRSNITIVKPRTKNKDPKWLR